MDDQEKDRRKLKEAVEALESDATRDGYWVGDVTEDCIQLDGHYNSKQLRLVADYLDTLSAD